MIKLKKKKKKKILEISSFYTSAPKTMTTSYTVPEIWRVTNVIFIFHFGLISASLPCWKPENSEFLKMKKKTPWDILIKNVYHKLWSDNVQFLRYGVEGTDRWTDGWKKWHIEDWGGAPTKTFFLIWIKIVKNKFQ